MAVSAGQGCCWLSAGGVGWRTGDGHQLRQDGWAAAGTHARAEVGAGGCKPAWNSSGYFSEAGFIGRGRLPGEAVGEVLQ